MHKILVRFDSRLEQVFEYSHERMAKKMAPMQRSAMARPLWDEECWRMYRRTAMGWAFCWVVLGSRLE